MLMTRMRLRMGIAIAIGALAVICEAWGSTVGSAQASVCDSKTSPANLNFTLPDMNGKAVALSSFTGKVILLNFWATWCGPCLVEIPSLVELSRRYRSRGLIVLGVSADDPVSALKPFAARLKMNYPVLVGNGRDDVQNAFPWLGLPTTFIIGRDGKICHEHTGLATKSQIEPIIKALL